MGRWCPEPESNRHDRNDRGILSPLCLPISPSGLIKICWRLGSESNRRTRSCSPLHDHSATQPYLYIQRGRTISKPRSMSMQWIKLLLLAVPGLKIICNMTYKPIFKFLGSVFLFTVMPNWNSRRAMIK